MSGSDQQRQRAAMELALVHRRMIEAYAFAITRDFHLADDVYQDVALVLMSQWDRLPDGEGLRFWLKEVIRRKCHELQRKQARLARMLSDEALERIGTAFPVEPEDGLAEAMARCVDRLAGDARAVVLGRYAEGLDVPTIAARIGRSVQGSYAVLKRARLALEECVERARRRELGT
jgi:RNA polymerase sigma-70 factor (ECF subfamily)